MDIEGIKERVNQRNEHYVYESEHEVQYHHDILYLLSIIEKAEKDLEGIEEIASCGSMDDFAYYQLARQALQAIRGKQPI